MNRVSIPPFPSLRLANALRRGGRLTRTTAYATLVALIAQSAPAAEKANGDAMFAEYFRAETARLAAQAFADIRTAEDWTARRASYRSQLLEMLGLAPLPEKTPLHATITGREEHAEFHVEKLHYQSLPGLYATGNLYVPKGLTGKAPAILYVCGHANVKQGGVSYGAKANYQHHGSWFARHGYVCLTIDTIQLGELEGLHHGTHREGMWWWNARGYTPAGVEAWNSVRALDYLQSRPEVDPERLGMTGRSGGGAYTWATAAIDERVKVAVPVAGITDLENYVVDGAVAGHCDCMFMVNTHRWDYTKLAAMLAPRPLLLANTDKDKIFPLDGVLRVHRAVAGIYALHGAADKLGLLITEGPHKDTQDLQVPALRWFNRFLKGEESLVEKPAVKLFTPAQLKVFPVAELPADQRTTRIHETFVPAAAPKLPGQLDEWRTQRDAWMHALREKVFAGWPATPEPLRPTKLRDEPAGGAVQVSHWQFTSQAAVPLTLAVHAPADRTQIARVHVEIADERGAAERDPALQAELEQGRVAIVYFAPRGIGATAHSGTPKDHIQVRRRFMLLGQTLDGMRVWDIARAVEALRQPELFGPTPVHLRAPRHQAINALYASLFTTGIAALELVTPPTTHMAGPDYLNVLRFLDVPQAAAMAAERCVVKWTGANPDEWSWTTRTAQQLGWPRDRLQW